METLKISLKQRNPFPFKRPPSKWSWKVVAGIGFAILLAFIIGFYFRELYIDYKNNKQRFAQKPEEPSTDDPITASPTDDAKKAGKAKV